MSIIFDMDGTLVDSAKITIPAFKLICPKYGLKNPKDEDIVSAIGYANPMFYYNIFPNEDKQKLQQFGKDVEKIEKEIICDVKDGLIFEGIEELLLSLQQRSIEIHIASTGDNEHVSTCLNHTKIISFFKEISCNKPDKEFMVADLITRYPSSTWMMLGDKRKDSNAAKYNNILAVGAGYGYCAKKDYAEFDTIIHTPLDLLKILDTLKT